VTPHYGVELVVEAVGRLAKDIPDIQLDVYGDGDGLPAARAMAEAHALGKRVYFSGRHEPQADVLARIHGAAAGVVANLPIPRNSLVVPAKLFEYVALHIPAVSSDLAAIREYFEPNEIAFFEAGKSDSLVRALQQTLTNPEIAAGRARAAFERYQTLRWDAEAARYIELLNRLAERRPESETAVAL
jgi:glycosyltransferase involved in cell wall biosynthesis